MKPPMVKRGCPHIFSKEKIYLVFLAPIFFACSYVLLLAYTEGDQYHYHKFYDTIAGASLHELISVARSILSASEPIPAIFLWIGSNLGIPKNIYISIINVVLLCGVFLILRRFDVRWPIILLVFSNFYLFVLLTDSERLKFAYILLVYSIVFGGVLGRLLLFSSPLAHLQSMILLAAMLFSGLSSHIRSLYARFAVKKKSLIVLSVLITLSILFLSFFEIPLRQKFYFYNTISVGFRELWQLFLLHIIGLVVLRERLRFALSFLILFVFVYLLGGSRVNMMGFTIFFYFSLLENKTNSPIVLILLGYLSLKTVFFVYNIFEHGDGFSGLLL